MMMMNDDDNDDGSLSSAQAGRVDAEFLVRWFLIVVVVAVVVVVLCQTDRWLLICFNPDDGRSTAAKCVKSTRIDSPLVTAFALLFFACLLAAADRKQKKVPVE